MLPIHHRISPFAAMAYIAAALVLNWPIGWLCVYIPPSAPTRAVTSSASKWPSWVPADWPALSTFVTPERLELTRLDDRDETSRHVARRLSTSEQSPRDCIVIEQSDWCKATTLYCAEDFSSPTPWFASEETYGVPWPALVAGHASSQIGYVDVHLPMWRFNVFGRVFALPVLPRFTALLQNTVVYFLVITIVRTTFLELRARRRRTIDRCTGCGYSAASLPICPECGTPKLATSIART